MNKSQVIKSFKDRFGPSASLMAWHEYVRGLRTSGAITKPTYDSLQRMNLMELASLNRTGGRRMNRAGSKSALRSISAARYNPVVYVTEQPDEELGGTRMDFVISQPGASSMADHMQSLQGSYWESDGPDFAYNMTTVYSDAERSEVLDELRNAGAMIQFADYGVPRGFKYGGGSLAKHKAHARALRMKKRGQKRPARPRMF